MKKFKRAAGFLLAAVTALNMLPGTLASAASSDYSKTYDFTTFSEQTYGTSEYTEINTASLKYRLVNEDGLSLGSYLVSGDYYTDIIKIEKDGNSNALVWTPTVTREGRKAEKHTLTFYFPENLNFENGTVTIDVTMKMPHRKELQLLGAKNNERDDSSGIGLEDWGYNDSPRVMNTLSDKWTKGYACGASDWQNSYYTYRFVVHDKIVTSGDETTRAYEVYCKPENGTWKKVDGNFTTTNIQDGITGIAFKTESGYDLDQTNTNSTYKIKNITVRQTASFSGRKTYDFSAYSENEDISYLPISVTPYGDLTTTFGIAKDGENTALKWNTGTTIVDSWNGGKFQYMNFNFAEPIDFSNGNITVDTTMKLSSRYNISLTGTKDGQNVEIPILYDFDWNDAPRVNAYKNGGTEPDYPQIGSVDHRNSYNTYRFVMSKDVNSDGKRDLQVWCKPEGGTWKQTQYVCPISGVDAITGIKFGSASEMNADTESVTYKKTMEIKSISIKQSTPFNGMKKYDFTEFTVGEDISDLPIKVTPYGANSATCAIEKDGIANVLKFSADTLNNGWQNTFHKFDFTFDELALQNGDVTIDFTAKLSSRFDFKILGEKDGANVEITPIFCYDYNDPPRANITNSEGQTEGALIGVSNYNSNYNTYRFVIGKDINNDKCPLNIWHKSENGTWIHVANVDPVSAVDKIIGIRFSSSVSFDNDTQKKTIELKDIAVRQGNVISNVGDLSAVADGKASLNASVFNITDDDTLKGDLIVALKDADGNLFGVKANPVSVKSGKTETYPFEFTGLDANKTYKTWVYLWNDVTSMEPITNAVVK